jgi:hypothetical protein
MQQHVELWPALQAAVVPQCNEPLRQVHELLRQRFVFVVVVVLLCLV